MLKSQIGLIVDGDLTPVVEIHLLQHQDKGDGQKDRGSEKGGEQRFPETGIKNHPIDHYLLLPVYEWGIADFHLEVTRPFIQKYHPTIGFSVNEAAYARRITVIGGVETFSEELLENFRQSGSIVERISGDGTSIATQLAAR